MYRGKYILRWENSQLKLLGKYAIEFDNLFPTQIVTATGTVSLPTSQPVSSHTVEIYGKVYIVTYLLVTFSLLIILLYYYIFSSLSFANLTKLY